MMINSTDTQEHRMVRHFERRCRCNSKLL